MFNKNKYQICRKVISKELADFLFTYLRIKKQTFYTLKRMNIDNKLLGFDGDEQAPETYSCYSDIAMETLLSLINEVLEKKTKLKLSPNYTYTRLYKNGDILKKHKDRFSCEISATLNLGGDMWPIYLEDVKGKEIEVKLKPGDLLIYRGMDLSHWRKPFEGYMCGQVFLHYNNKRTKGWDKNLYDGRPHLGFPFKTKTT
jgi:alkylated DNA repair dioxygenase AlkB